MFQGIRELAAARGRTLLIVVTVGMITIMVTFLSSLAAGLSTESTGALRYRMDSVAGPDSALVLSDVGSTGWSSSHLTPAQLDLVDKEGGQPLYLGRDTIGSDPVIYMSDPSVAPGQAVAGPSVAADHTDLHPGTAHLTLERGDALSLDHVPVVRISPQDAAALPRTNVAAVLPAGAADIPGTTTLRGEQRWNASSSYQGEQTSLRLMVTLLYLISGLVLGAFFIVWTMQRLRGVAISAALGASRSVLATDSLGQAVIVLAAGITTGAAVTVIAASVIGSSLPVTVNPQTTVQPALILALCGLVGAAVSLRPVLTASPRTALTNA